MVTVEQLAYKLLPGGTEQRRKGNKTLLMLLVSGGDKNYFIITGNDENHVWVTVNDKTEVIMTTK
jgi:hypothetical protein